MPGLSGAAIPPAADLDLCWADTCARTQLTREGAPSAHTHVWVAAAPLLTRGIVCLVSYAAADRMRTCNCRRRCAGDPGAQLQNTSLSLAELLVLELGVPRE